MKNSQIISLMTHLLRRGASLISVLIFALNAGCADHVATNDDGWFEDDQSSFISAGSLDSTAVVESIHAPIDHIEHSQSEWMFGEVTGRLLQTPNFRIHTTMDKQRILQRLPVFFERCLQNYRTALADLPAPPTAFETYLFKNRREWKIKMNEVLPNQAGQFTNLGRGGIATRGIAVLYHIDFYEESSRDTLAIAAHEGWHQYTQKTFEHQLPVWLEEGIATYMEGYTMDDNERPEFKPWWNRERRGALREAVAKDRLLSLRELLEGSPQQLLSEGKTNLLTYYAQVWALTRFLAEGEGGRYAPALTRVLEDAAEGRLVGRLMQSRPRSPARRPPDLRQLQRGPRLILEYFNPDFGEFEREYARFIREILRPTGRNRAGGGHGGG